jgi:hypothetical protein
MKFAALACLFLAAGMTAAAGDRDLQPAQEKSGLLVERYEHSYLFPDFFEPGVHAALAPSVRGGQHFTLTQITHRQRPFGLGYEPGTTTSSLGRLRLKAHELEALESYLQAGSDLAPKTAATVAKVLKRMRSQHRTYSQPAERPLPRQRVLDERDLSLFEGGGRSYPKEPEASVVLPGMVTRGPL